MAYAPVSAAVRRDAVTRFASIHLLRSISASCRPSRSAFSCPRPAASDERLRLPPEDGYHRYFDWQRLRDQVLIPLTSGTAAVYRCYDWSTGALAEEETRVSRSGTVIVEEVFAARPELAGYYDLTVYVDTPRETCLRRQYARGDDHGPGDWTERRRAAEEHYLAATQPATQADLTVKGF
ncbi:hypothetical protein AB0H86_02445 [Streptomyces sp. NPDC050997]|uniref:hypothetical protein n=1 Tax=Streptomyces sp. NPDC050997 TaxID=3155519 RepID=UPI00341A012C